MMTSEFRKSTFSNPSGNCVEAAWRKSSFSGPAGHCTEVRRDSDTILVRDSKDNGAGPTLGFTIPEWEAFIAGVKDGQFDVQ